jgi:hypothetical protein
MNRAARQLSRRRRLVGVGSFALTAVLTIFHGRLLWQRLNDGSLLQPVVVARWVLSALLVLALLQLWSKGLPVLRGRRAGVLWLVVVVLHAVAPGGSLPAVEPVGEGLLPAALAALAFLAIAVTVARGQAPGSIVRPTVRRRQSRRQRRTGWCRALFSRPPPVALHP